MNPFGYGQFLPVFGMKILSSGCTQCHTHTLTHSGSWKRGLYYVLPSSPVVFVVVYLIASSVVGLCSSGVRPICNTKKEQVECNWIQHKTLLLLTYCTLKSQEKKEKARENRPRLLQKQEKSQRKERKKEKKDKNGLPRVSGHSFKVKSFIQGL